MSFPHPPRAQAPDAFTPQPGQPTPGSVPAHLEQWLNGLARHPHLQQAELLCLTLEQYNNERLLPTTRLVLLERLRPAAFAVCQQIERQFGSDGQEGAFAPHVAAKLMQLLHLHLRRGYQICAAAQDALAPEQLASALQRCLRSAKQVQIYAALQQRRSPDGLWLKLHQQYQTAVRRNLHRIAVNDSTLPMDPHQTIEQAYTDNLLLALIQPLRLSCAHLRTLASHLSHLCRHVEILPATPGSRLSLATDLDQPFHAFSGAALSPTLELDSQSLLQALDTAGGLLEEAVLRGLRLILNGRLPPRIVPAPIGRTVEVVLDICQLRQHVNNSYPGSQSLPTTLSCQNKRSANVRLAGCACGTEKRQRSEAPPLPTRYNAKLLSNTGGGICLQWPHGANDRLHAGMLLAIRTSPTALWKIERLAWAMYDSHGQMIVTLGD